MPEFNEAGSSTKSPIEGSQINNNRQNNKSRLDDTDNQYQKSEGAVVQGDTTREQSGSDSNIDSNSMISNSSLVTIGEMPLEGDHIRFVTHILDKHTDTYQHIHT